MAKLASFAIAVAAVAACSSSKNNNKTDAPVTHEDSPSGSDSAMNKDAPSGATVTIAGTASIVGGGQTVTPGGLAGVTLTPYDSSGGSAGSATTSAADGSFTLTVASGFDGYIEATASTYVDTYAWVAAPVNANVTGAAVGLMTQTQITMGIFTNCGVTQNTADALIALKVETVSGGTATPVTGATVSSTPSGTACYTTKQANGNEKPVAADTSTDASGVVLLLNVAPNWLSISATATGDTFTTTTLIPTANVLTTTLVLGT